MINIGGGWLLMTKGFRRVFHKGLVMSVSPLCRTATSFFFLLIRGTCHESSSPTTALFSFPPPNSIFAAQAELRVMCVVEIYFREKPPPPLLTRRCPFALSPLPTFSKKNLIITEMGIGYTLFFFFHRVTFQGLGKGRARFRVRVSSFRHPHFISSSRVGVYIPISVLFFLLLLFFLF